MKNRVNLKIYKFIKWWFIICGIVLPIFVLFLKLGYGKNVSWVAIVGFPILCFLIVKFIDICIRKTNKDIGIDNLDKNDKN